MTHETHAPRPAARARSASGLPLLSAGTLRTIASELTGVGRHLASYPSGVRRQRLAPTVPLAPALPVVLVHGYLHNRSGFRAMVRALGERGAGVTYSINQPALGASIRSLAQRLSAEVDLVRRRTGSARVHVVGHSLGGIVARWYIEQDGGWRHVERCVTIGTPHGGTTLARLVPGRIGRELRPGSRPMRALADSAGRAPTTILNLYAELDVFITPPDSAVLPDHPAIENRCVPGVGHLSLLISSDVVDAVCDHVARRGPADELAPRRRERDA